jgi:hypothetical protein
MCEIREEDRIITPGPAGFLPLSAAQLGVTLSDPGQGIYSGHHIDEEKVMEEAATRMLTEKNATIFPGPMILWSWNQHAIEKANAVLEMAAQIPNVRIIPMPDYRPKYPKIDPEEAINPNHPNLTILHNKIEACIFVGVHCHYANLTLKMIRSGTNCCTIALCAQQGHEDAMLSVRDCDLEKLQKMTAVIKRVRDKMGIELPASGEAVQFTPTQSTVNAGKSHVDPLASQLVAASV